MRKIHYLWFDAEDNRYHLGTYGLHCGDCFEAFIDGEWVDTRIEHSSDGWFIVTHPKQELEGLMVRRAE